MCKIPCIYRLSNIVSVWCEKSLNSAGFYGIWIKRKVSVCILQHVITSLSLYRIHNSEYNLLIWCPKVKVSNILAKPSVDILTWDIKLHVSWISCVVSFVVCPTVKVQNFSFPSCCMCSGLFKFHWWHHFCSSVTTPSKHVVTSDCILETYFHVKVQSHWLVFKFRRL